ncbi:DEAD/DEAH box helicase [Aureimonas sp. AU40]|uniref:DEAD/DEAH box helicase n=1 Tax=Aureimonas sp. AU40 TaxID=1637747 RepID=UPI000782F115|nr:DEAD/DEAH box helicase [Aureimonas sp. AU40]
MQNIRLAHNATVAKLVDRDREVDNIVSDLLSYTVEGHEFMHAFQTGTWSGKSSFYSHENGTFPAGFVNVVRANLVKAGRKVHLVRDPLPQPLGPESPIVDEFGNDDPRYDFQLKALRQVEKHGAGIIQVATGGGKSKIAKLIMARYRRPTLFLTTRGVLLYQMQDQLNEIGMNSGQIGDGEFKLVRGVNLGMVQTFVKRLEEPSLDKEIRKVIAKGYDESVAPEKQREIAAKKAQVVYDRKLKRRSQAIEFLSMVEVVIGEEAHEAGGSSYYEILRHCKKARIRVALTATPFMRQNAEDNLRLMAAFGPVLIQITEEMLIARGVLARPVFKFVTSKPHEKLRRTSPFQRAYEFGYMKNPFMHKDIIRDALMAKRFGLPVMTLIVRTEHGDTLKAKMEHLGLRVEFIRGENDQDARKKALRQLGRGEIDVVIGTTILDVGVDVPSVGLVQLAGGYKAEISLRQRIGRGLRAKRSGPNVAFIADYSVSNNKSLGDHSRQRRAIVEATPGFAENILPDGQDFDWSQFERKDLAA